MPSTNLEAQIAEIQTALLSRCDELGAVVAKTVRSEVSYYRDTGTISRDEHTASCTENLRFIFQGLGASASFDTTVATRTGSVRALAGTPLPAIMEAYRIGCRLIWEEIGQLAAANPHIERETLLRTTGRVWLAQDVFTQAMASAYREEMTRQVVAQVAERAALVEALVEGRVEERASLWEITTMLRLPAGGPFVIVAAECAALGKAALPSIEAKLSSLDISSAWRLLPDVQIGLVHVRTDAKFDTLKHTLSVIATTRTGISGRFSDLGQTPDAVHHARIALSVEQGDGSLVSVFEPEPLCIAAITAPRVMKQISAEIFQGFDDLEEPDRRSLFTTFRTWMATGGSINETAEQLYCHPNTVRQRLHRIEDRTGKSLSHPRQLAELCLMFEIDLLAT